MFFNKIIKNLNIKNFLVASLLISSMGISQNINASFFIKRKTVLKTYDVIATLTVVSAIIAIYVASKCATASNRGGDEADIMDNFHGNGNFGIVEGESGNLYRDKTWFPSNDSLDSDYPAQWLENDATSNKRYLRFMGLFSQEKSELADRLQNGLNNLNNNAEFRGNRRDFNDKVNLQPFCIHKRYNFASVAGRAIFTLLSYYF